MKRLIIADIKSVNNNGKCTGHYFSVAQNYKDLFEKECKLLIAGGPIYQTQFKDDSLFKLPHSVCNKDSFFKKKWKVFKNFIFLLKNTTPDDVIVMQQSGAATMLLFLSILAKQYHKIFIIEYGTESRAGFIKNIIFNLAKKKVKGVICPNDRIGKTYERPYCVVTDYIYAGNGINLKEEYLSKKYDFSIVGSILLDKGVVESAEKVAQTKYTMIIAGKPCNAEIEEKLKSIALKAPNIKLHLGYISNEEYYGYIKNSRYSILNYSGCYSDRSSGVVLDMIFNGVPILGRNCNAFKFIEDKKLGYLFENIENVDFDKFMDDEIYNNYRSCIDSYLKEQLDYKKNLLNFLLGIQL